MVTDKHTHALAGWGLGVGWMGGGGGAEAKAECTFLIMITKKKKKKKEKKKKKGGVGWRKFIICVLVSYHRTQGLLSHFHWRCSFRELIQSKEYKYNDCIYNLYSKQRLYL